VCDTVYLFGAGAEIPLGMPSGGRFALEVISDRYDAGIREKLKSAIGASSRDIKENPTRSNNYAAWSGIGRRRTNSVNAPDSRDQRAIFASTIENSRDAIWSAIQGCDEAIRRMCDAHGIDLPNPVDSEQLMDENLLIRHAGGIAQLIQSGAIRSLISLASADHQAGNYVWPVLRMYFELAIAIGGKDLAAALNNIQLGDADTTQHIFQNANQLFQVDFGNLGIEAFEIAVSRDFPNCVNCDGASAVKETALEIITSVVEGIVDYQRLIERFLPSLYKPSVSWAKFTKAAFLLHRMQAAIRQSESEASANTDSYYTDIVSAGLGAKALFATTNYTNLIVQNGGINRNDIIWLNGHVDARLDPYRNEVLTDADAFNGHIVVPYMIAQSVVKPMMTPETIEEYARFSTSVGTAERVVVIGYGFGAIDSHVNAVIRHAVEQDGGPMVDVLIHEKDPTLTEARQTIVSRLRFNLDPGHDRLRVHRVDDERRVDGISWTDVIS
jgi:hypothetical protein